MTSAKVGGYPCQMCPCTMPPGSSIVSTYIAKKLGLITPSACIGLALVAPDENVLLLLLLSGEEESRREHGVGVRGARPPSPWNMSHCADGSTTLSLTKCLAVGANHPVHALQTIITPSFMASSKNFPSPVPCLLSRTFRCHRYLGPCDWSAGRHASAVLLSHHRNASRPSCITDAFRGL